MKKLSAFLSSPLGVVIIVAAVVLGAELLIMILLEDFLRAQFTLSDMAWNLFDAITLTAVVSPMLYFIVFRRINREKERFRQLNEAGAKQGFSSHRQATVWL